MRQHMMKTTVLFASMMVGSALIGQNKAGLALLSEERWAAAEKEFSKSTEEMDVFYAGLSQFKSEEFEKAKTSFNSIAAKPFGKIGLGLLELNTGNVAGADKLFEEAANATKNKNPEIFVAISRAIANSNAANKEKGIEWAKKASDMQKNNADYRQVYGESYLATTDGGNAITQYEYAAQYNPKSAMPFAKIGQVYFRNRNYSLMKENLDKALALDPNNVFANAYMAQLYYKYKGWDTAQMYQQKVLDLGGSNVIENTMMANILYEKKDYNGAINLINQIIKEDNKANYLVRLIGYSYLETGKPQEAVTFLEKFLETQPKDKIIARDYEYLGKAYMAAGDAEKGAATMKKSLELNPSDREAMLNLAKTFYDGKRLDDALELYTKIVALTDPAPVAQDYFQIGQIHYTKKNWPDAEAAYTKAVELAPTSATAYYQRAMVKTFADPEQATASAKPDYLKFVELSVGNEKLKKQIVKANLYLAKDAIKNLNDKVEGKKYIDAALAIDPANTEANDLLKFVQ